LPYDVWLLNNDTARAAPDPGCWSPK